MVVQYGIVVLSLVTVAVVMGNPVAVLERKSSLNGTEVVEFVERVDRDPTGCKAGLRYTNHYDTSKGWSINDCIGGCRARTPCYGTTFQNDQKLCFYYFKQGGGELHDQGANWVSCWWN